jgi:ketosteroid isomerase-like protein
MSQENVELVRELFDAFARGDVEGAFQRAASDFTFDVTRTDLEGGVHTGRQAILEFLGNWMATWEEHEMTILDFIDAGDRVVAVVHERGRVKDIDTWVEHVRGVVLSIRDGQLARYDEYMDKRSALEAVGLSE